MLPWRFWSGVVVGLLLAHLVPAGAEQYSLRFSRPNNTRMSWSPSFPNWSYTVPVQFSASGDSSSMLRLSAAANMGYTLDQRSGRNLWQDNASISGSINYPILGPRASIGVRGSMSTRNATLQKQKIRSRSYGFSFQYRPFREGTYRSLNVSLVPGVITASRASRANLDSTIQETGIQYSAALSVSPAFDLAGKKLNTSFSLNKRDNTLKNNKDRNESLRLSWRYTLPRDVRANLSVSESRSQQGLTRRVIGEEQVDGEVLRDTAVVAETNLTRNTGLSSSVSFKVGRFDVKTNGGYSENLHTNTANAAEDPGNRFFGTDRKSNGWRFDASVSGKMAEGLVGRTSLKYNATDEGLLPVRLADGRAFRDPTRDREDRDLVVNGALDWDLAENHALTLSGLVRSIADDNPGAPQQDRDVFSSNSSLSYKGTLASGLKLDIGLRTSFSHRVSLHASRSSGNSRNRDLSLDAGGRYERLGASITHKFGLSARRTVYDFDRQVNPNDRQRKSNIRRGWSMAHTINRKFFDHLRLNSRYSYTADDFGRLIVESGAQLVEEDNGDHNFSFRMSYNPTRIFSTSISYTYRLDRQWDHRYANGQERRELRRRNAHRNLGATINYSPSTETTLNMGGSRSRQKSGTFDSFNITYIRKI